MKDTAKPTLTKRQTDILLLLFRFRFLTRPKIQQLLQHKNHRLVTRWLNELTDLGYLIKYDAKLVVMPAFYSLGKLSRKYLKKQKLVKQTPHLDRVWWEAHHTVAFREKCLFVADIYLSLLSRFGEGLRFWSKADLYGYEYLIEPPPDVYFVTQTKSKKMRYFLDAFTYAPPKAIKNRIEHYRDYFYSSEWEDNVDKTFPDIIIICPNQRMKRYFIRYVKEEFSDESDLHFHIRSADEDLK